MQTSEIALGQRDPAATTPFDDIDAVHALYHQRIFRFLLMSVRDRDAAMSITQDTFLNAWRYRATFRGDCSIITWLTRIAVNLLRDHTRTDAFQFWKRSALTSVSADDLALGLRHPGASAEGALLAKDRLRHLWQSVEQLSDRQRVVFLLRFVEEMELNEIANATGMPLPTVKSHLYRALDHVRATERGQR